MPNRLLPIVFACLAALATPALAQSVEAVNEQLAFQFGDAAKMEEAIATFQQAVRDGDAETVAALVSYPITVTIDGEDREFADAEEFADSYDEIITPHIAEVVAQQDYAALFVNVDGVMFGSGEVWLTALCEDEACDNMEAKVVTIQDTGSDQ